MDQLTDDVLVEILSRVPYRSLRRFTCVSRRWRDLIAHPDHRLKLPQTLAGFFYHASTRCFVNVSGTGPPFVDPSLAFLPDRERKGLDLLDGCNGLLLCRCFRFPDPNVFDYLVINPATQKWVPVPVSRRRSSKVQTVRLGFEPAVSSHFHVFEFHLNWDGDGVGDEDARVLGAKIYSSETGLWSYKESGWEVGITPDPVSNSVFVDGTLYVIANECLIAAVDVEGRTWRIIDFPRSQDSPFFGTDAGFIDLSQGKLHFANSVPYIISDKLAIWVLEDRNSEEWTLKHTVSFMHLVRKKRVHFGYDGFIVVAIHPDRNMVFFVFGDNKNLMSYDMDSGEVRTIQNLGQYCYAHYIPYVPLSSVACVDGQQ